jgi:hypothetical protein
VATAVYNILTATPTFSPAGGNYTAAQTVTIGTATSGASIRYTTDGSTPSDTVGTVYNGPVTVNATTTLKAVAYATGLTNSSVATAVYNILATTPTFSPAGGNYTAAQTVTISTTTSGAAIRYTTDGSTPSDTVGTVYSGPVTVNATTTLKAVAYAIGLTNSSVAIAVYNILATTPTFSPAGGNYTAAQTVTISTTTSGAAIRYTTDGSTPSDTVGTVYSGPVTVGATTTLKAVAYASGLTNSSVATAVYTITLVAAPPTFSPAAGTYTSAQVVTISTPTTGAAIRYTIDGSTPSDTVGTIYSGPVTVSATTTLKAIAYASGYTNSSVATAVYNIQASILAITSLSPTSGPVGTILTITGTNFGATQGGSQLIISGFPVAPTSWSATRITVAVPYWANGSNVTVKVVVDGVASNTWNFTLTPNITGVFPPSGTVGTNVTITGINFGANQGASTVTFNGAAATPTSWSDSYISVAVPSGATTGNLVVTVAGVPSNGWNFPVPPSVTSLSPTTGAAGVQVTISGSGFGATQGTSAVWLGSTFAKPISWSDTRVVATVAANATSGTAQVQRGGYWSDPLPFVVSTATISNVTPSSGVPGTQVTISGSGFGAVPGSGQVWLGTLAGVVQSWSDAQVVATVAPGSTSGNAQVLQNGVMSNAVPFSVNMPHITAVSPPLGVPGTSVTITGTGFGSFQGSGGNVLLGSTSGQVLSWSDTQVVALVASTSLTGIAQIQQNGVASNAVGFTVPVPGGNIVLPALLNMVVGDTHTVQALGPTGQPAKGLTWTSSDPTVVSLSSPTDDPPVLTALSAGHVKITGGTATVDVTVSAGALPLGTVLWSNPGNGSGVAKIVPAVPSPSGVADVFAFQGDGTVQAITSDGLTAWTAYVGDALNGGQFGQAVPDFQGGLVVMDRNANSIVKLDGMTGQGYTAYTADQSSELVCLYSQGSDSDCHGVAVHTDGTIFAIQHDPETDAVSVIGIKPTTGTHFSVPLDSTGTGTFGPATALGLIIAGDGYAYVPYQSDECGYKDATEYYHLKLLRVGSDGSYTNISIHDWSIAGHLDPCEVPVYAHTGIITNADTGIVLTWAQEGTELGMAITTGSAVSLVGAPTIAGQNGAIVPVLQAQDGSFVGTAQVGDPENPTPYMVAFDATGSVRWSVPNEQPQIATEDGGVIGQSGVTYDQNGSATGQISLPTYSWTGNAYQVGPVAQLLAPFVKLAVGFWPFKRANSSGNLAAAKVTQLKLRTFKLNGAKNIDFAGIVRDAQDTWSKQSNGTIALWWDHSIQNVDPCGVPNCTTDDSSYLNVLSTDIGPLWTQSDYFLKKFPIRQGINVVHNAALPQGVYGITLPVPVSPYPSFNGGSNVIVLPNDTAKVLGHEVGHVLGLTHVSTPLNLMCGVPPGTDNWAIQALDSFWCFVSTSYSLNDGQLATAKAKALSLVEK